MTINATIPMKIIGPIKIIGSELNTQVKVPLANSAIY